VTQVLTNESSSLRSNVALLLLSYTDFDAFSNNEWRTNQSPGTFGSLEDIHNEIHDKVGGNGHMAALEVAAFDPVFWLHHANVDRLWAIWQDLNPGSQLEARPAPQSTFTTEQGTSETSQSSLEPFWDASGGQTFWTADGVKDSKTFGYAYPETQSWQFADNDAYQQALRQTVTQLYGGNVFQNLQQSLAAKATMQSAAPVVAAPTAHAKTTVAVAADEAAKPIGHTAPAAPITVATATPATHAQLAASRPDKAKAGPIVNVTPITDGQNGDPPPAVHEIHVESHGDEQGQQAQHTLVAPHIDVKHETAHHSTVITPTAKPTTNQHIPASLAHLAPDNTYNEWIVNIRALKHGLDQTFRVLVFLGPVAESDPAEWDVDPNLVGRVSVLGQSSVHCAKCRSDKENALVVSGTVVLTGALLEKVVVEGGLASLDPAEVVPYLRSNLGWRVRVFSGEEKDVGNVPGLEVSVCSTRVRIGDDGMPIYSGEYELHPEVTQGRAGGVTVSA
jgi:tyrosinase